MRNGKLVLTAFLALATDTAARTMYTKAPTATIRPMNALALPMFPAVDFSVEARSESRALGHHRDALKLSVMFGAVISHCIQMLNWTIQPHSRIRDEMRAWTGERDPPSAIAISKAAQKRVRKGMVPV